MTFHGVVWERFEEYSMLQVERPAALDAWKAKVRPAMTSLLTLFQLTMDELQHQLTDLISPGIAIAKGRRAEGPMTHWLSSGGLVTRRTRYYVVSS